MSPVHSGGVLVSIACPQYCASGGPRSPHHIDRRCSITPCTHRRLIKPTQRTATYSMSSQTCVCAARLLARPTSAPKSTASRSAFFTGSRLAAAAPAPRAAARRSSMQESVRALFGGGSAATAGKSVYDFEVTSIDGRPIKFDRFKGKVLLIVNVASACGFTPQYDEMTELYNKYGRQGLEVLAFPCNQVCWRRSSSVWRGRGDVCVCLEGGVNEPHQVSWLHFAAGTHASTLTYTRVHPPPHHLTSAATPPPRPTPVPTQFGAQEPGSNSEIKSFAERKGFKGPMFAKIEVNGVNTEPLWAYLKNQQGGLLTSDIKWNFSKFLVDRTGKVVKRYGSTTAPLAIEADIKALL